MPGSHEPASNRSFYLSLAGSTLKAAVVIALLVGGVFVMANAFEDQGGRETTPTTTPTTSPTSSPTSTPTKPPKAGPPAELEGTPTFVFNTTTETGLAAKTANKLVKRYGVVVPGLGTAKAYVGDASARDTTAVYYRAPAAKESAQWLAGHFFPGGTTVGKLPPGTDVPKDALIVVYLGNDFVSK